jgi:hypothetical protein
MLLQHVRGPTSYEDLKTVNTIVCSTYKEACIQLLLLRDDLGHIRCLEEASMSRMPPGLRKLFAYLIVHCDVVDATILFDRFAPEMTNDFRLRGLSEEGAREMALKQIASHVHRISGRILHEEESLQGLFTFEIDLNEEEPLEVLEGTDIEAIGVELEDHITSLNANQREVYDTIMVAVDGQEGTVLINQDNCYFVNGPKGTGKSYLYVCIIKALRSRHMPYVCVAWTGIASLLLDGGATIHLACP